MAEKQKGWDMERVALLQKIKSNPPRREWQSLSEEEINETLDNNLEGGTSLFDICRAIEQALKEKNA
jgi:aerobic-type carbon monoxide dehydrogenase small subunit (CoxS/CutS family)